MVGALIIYDRGKRLKYEKKNNSSTVRNRNRYTKTESPRINYKSTDVTQRTSILNGPSRKWRKMKTEKT